MLFPPQVPPVPSVTNLDIKTEHNGPDSQITYASSNLNTHTNTSYESDGLDQRYHYYQQQQQHHHQLEQQPPILTSTSARNTSLLARQHRRRHRLRYSLEDDSSSSSSNSTTNTLDQVLTPTTTTNTVTTASLHSFSLIPIIPEQQHQSQQSRRPADCSVIVTAPPRTSQRTPWVEQLHVSDHPFLSVDVWFTCEEARARSATVSYT